MTLTHNLKGGINPFSKPPASRYTDEALRLGFGYQKSHQQPQTYTKHPYNANINQTLVLPQPLNGRQSRHK